MSSLRVVVVSIELPDPFGSAAARWYYVLAKGLALRGNSVTWLAAYSRAAGDQSVKRAKDHFSAISVRLKLYPYPEHAWLPRKWRTLTRPYSFFISEELRQDLEQCLREGYDVLNLEQMWAGYLGMGVKRALLSIHHLQLLDLAGIVFPSGKFLVSKYLMQRAERHIVARSTNIRVTSERLHVQIGKLNPRARIFKAPEAIDPELYQFERRDTNMKTIGLIASLSWYPGYNAAIRLLTRIWPKVRKEVPDANLLIAGWNARRTLARYLGGSGVTVVENVPDPKVYFRKLSVLVYPLSQGSGMKIKLLEAMAYGTPVVTTTEGAEGLSAVDSRHAFIADEDDKIVEGTVNLLRDQDLANRMSLAARALVENEYSPGPIVGQIENIYEQLQ
jgi:glycosyltransferase involved in cell wall biosynthesis